MIFSLSSSIGKCLGKPQPTFGLPSPDEVFESGQTEPCLGSLAVLAKAFGLGLADLLEGV